MTCKEKEFLTLRFSASYFSHWGLYWGLPVKFVWHIIVISVYEFNSWWKQKKWTQWYAEREMLNFIYSAQISRLSNFDKNKNSHAHQSQFQNSSAGVFFAIPASWSGEHPYQVTESTATELPSFRRFHLLTLSYSARADYQDALYNVPLYTFDKWCRS